MAVLRQSTRIALVAGLLTMPCFVSDAGPITEPQAKASLLFNLVAFVEWPGRALGPGDRVSICVAADPDIVAALRPYDGRAIDGHPVSSRAIADDADPSACHILFVSGSRAQGLALVGRAVDRSVLTVGDGAEFARQGGAIRVFFEQSRLRFEINTTVVSRAQLKISSKMLGLARLVRSDGK